jgi:hypothetical protein
MGGGRDRDVLLDPEEESGDAPEEL